MNEWRSVAFLAAMIAFLLALAASPLFLKICLTIFLLFLAFCLVAGLWCAGEDVWKACRWLKRRFVEKA